MGKNKKRTGRNGVPTIDRNVIASVGWTDWEPAGVPPELQEQGIFRGFVNNKFSVALRSHKSSAFRTSTGEPVDILELIVKVRDKKYKATESEWWDAKMRIKDELCGVMAEMVELYPSHMRLMPMTECHLWVLPQGMQFPVGIVPQGSEGDVTRMQEFLDSIPKTELEVFIIKNEGYTEVFSNEDEAKAGYEGEEYIGEYVPLAQMQDEDADNPYAWSNLASEKAQALQDKIAEFTQGIADEVEEDDAVIKVDTNESAQQALTSDGVAEEEFGGSGGNVTEEDGIMDLHVEESEKESEEKAARELEKMRKEMRKDRE